MGEGDEKALPELRQNGIVTVKGDELGPVDADIVTLRKAAQDFWDANHKSDVDRKGNVVNPVIVNHPQLGEIEITSKGRRKFFSSSANPLKLRMVPKLKEIIQSARVVGEPVKNYKYNPSDNILQDHWLENNVDVSGKIYTVGIQVFEDHKGNKFYNLTADIEKRNGPQITHHNDRGHEPSEKRGNPPYEQMVAPDDDGINLRVGQLAQSPRGSYTPATDTIKLFEAADLSTFAHESGHRWLFEMADDLGDSRLTAEARQRISADVKATLDYLGVKGIDPATATPQAIKDALTVEQHEKWARSVEAYLREGRAPDPALKGVFKRLSAWLMQIYRSATQLNVELTPDIRRVMDRLLASDEALASAETGRALSIPPEIMAEATPKERATLEAALEQARAEGSTLAGGDVAVDAARLLTGLARMDPAKAAEIIGHVRLGADTMTAREALMHRDDPQAQQVVDQWVQMMQAADMEQTAARQQDARTAAGLIRDEVAQAIRDTGAGYSTKAASTYGSLIAARTLRRAADRGMDPLDLWAAERPVIRGESGRDEVSKAKAVARFSAADLTLWQDMKEPAITKEIADAIGRQAGPIRLQAGDEKAGLIHIEIRHGEQARRLGYADARAMVADILRNFDAIYKGNGRTLILAKRTPTRGQVYIQLEPSDDGDFYDVKTATPSREGQFKNKEPLWERTGPSTPPAEAGSVNPSDQSGELTVAHTDGGDKLEEQARGSYAPATSENAGEMSTGQELRQPTTPRGTAWGSLAGDVSSFTADVARVLRDGARRNVTVRVGETPLVFNRLGVTRRELRMFESKIEKIIKHDHPAVGPDQLGRAAALLADPVMVMRSATESGALVAVLDDVDANGDFLVAAIHPSDGTVQFDKLASVYGKERTNPQGSAAEDWIASNVNRGAVLFFNTKKAPRLSDAARVYIPAVQKVRGQNPTMLTERDLVKARRGKPHLYQDQETARGSYTPATDTIKLFEAADLSTFAHESGHRWLFEMADDLGDSRLTAEARQRISADVKATLDYLGVKGIDPATATPQAIKDALTVEQHEKWARSVEAYLREGRAPDPVLKGVFKRLSAWLMQIYRSATQLNVELTPDIRRVMDRLLASDEALASAEAGRALSIPPEIMAEATPKERTTLEAALEQARAEGTATVAGRLLAEEAARRKKAYQEEKAQVRDEITAQVQDMPQYRAVREIRGTKDYQLDRQVMINEYGAETVKGLPRGITTEGGTHPDLVAEALGFASGTDLVLALLDARQTTEKSAIKDRVSAEMARRYGDLRTDGGLEDAAAVAVGEHWGEVLEIQAKILRRMAWSTLRKMASRGDIADPSASADETKIEIRDAAKAVSESSTTTSAATAQMGALAKEAALADSVKRQRDMIAASVKEIYKALDRKVIREAAVQWVATRPIKALKPNMHRVAAAKAGRETALLVARNDFSGAADSISRQMINLAQETEVRKAQDDVRKMMADWRKLNRPDSKLAGDTDIDHITTARIVLHSHGIGRKGDVDPQEFFARLMAEDAERAGKIAEAINPLLDQAKPLDQMTVADMRRLNDGINSLIEAGRQERSMLINGQRVEFDNIATALEKQLEGDGLLKEDKPRTHQATKAEERLYDWMSALAGLRRVEHWAMQMDNGRVGVLTRMLFRPVEQATTRYRLARHSQVTGLVDLLKPFKESLSKPRKILAPELGAGGFEFANKGQLLHAIGHMGNDSNRRKMIVGRGWGKLMPDGSVDTTAWDSFVRRMIADGTLTRQDFDLVQALWDQFEATKPLAQAAHKRMYGYEFEEVPATPLVTPFGTYRGGYLPAITSKTEVTQAPQNPNADDIELLAAQMGYAQPGGERGFTKARTDYDQPLELNLASLPRHMDAVLKFVHIMPQVRDAARLLNTKRMKDLMRRADPHATENLLLPWLTAAVRQTAETPPSPSGKKLARTARWLNKTAGMQAMAGNVINAAQNALGVIPAMLEVSPKRLGRALIAVARQPQETAQAVMDKSDYMRTRMDSAMNDMAGELKTILDHQTGRQKVAAWAEQHAYLLQAIVQDRVDTVTWMGGYEQAIEQGQSEADAIQSADAAVRMTQGSFAPEALSQAERGNAIVRLFTKFYGYFNTQGNLMLTRMTLAARKKDYRRMAAVFFIGVYAPSVAAELISQAIRGTLGDEDDDGILDDLAEVFMLAPLKYMGAFVPVGGAITNALIGQVTDRPTDDRVSLTAGSGLVDSTITLGRAAYGAVKSDDYSRLPLVASDALALMTGIPTRWLARPISYLINVAEGDANPEHIGNAASGLLTGRDGTE